MNLSGGPFSYNRFDAYEEGLSEGKGSDGSTIAGASTPEEMKKKVDKAGKKAKGRGAYLEKDDEKEESKEEEGTAEGGDGGGMSESAMFGRNNKPYPGQGADNTKANEFRYARALNDPKYQPSGPMQNKHGNKMGRVKSPSEIEKINKENAKN